MNYAGSHDGFGPGRLDRAGQAVQPVAADEQAVFEAPVPQLRQHPAPKAGTLGGGDPDPQHVLEPIDAGRR